MGQYFTDRLQEVFHMIFTSYDQKAAQDGLRRLELIVNNQNTDSYTTHHGLRSDGPTPAESTELTDQELYIMLKNPEERELGDAYALLARVYAGPHFTWEESGFPEDNMRTYQSMPSRQHSPAQSYRYFTDIAHCRLHHAYGEKEYGAIL